MNRFHRERVAQDKGKPFLLTEVRQPLPGEPTFVADDHILSIRSNHLQKRLRRRREIFVDEFRAVFIQNTDVPRFRMEIDATLVFMLVRVKVHPGVLLGEGLVVQPSYRCHSQQRRPG